MSQYLDSLQIGDTVDIRGPDGKVVYLGRGWYELCIHFTNICPFYKLHVHLIKYMNLFSVTINLFVCCLGYFKLSKTGEVRHATNIGLIAGGTGKHP